MLAYLICSSVRLGRCQSLFFFCGLLPVSVAYIRSFVFCLDVQHVSSERCEAYKLAPLALDHEGCHGLQFDYPQKLDVVLALQPIYVVSDSETDENVAFVRKEALEVVRDSAGDGHLEEKGTTRRRIIVRGPSYPSSDGIPRLK